MQHNYFNLTPETWTLGFAQILQMNLGLYGQRPLLESLSLVGKARV